MEVELARLQLSRETEAAKKSRLGQYLTPQRTAVFMAGLFSRLDGSCLLLDAGAGIGSLSHAFLTRCKEQGLFPNGVELDAYELDESLHVPLAKTLSPFEICTDVRIHSGDFIHTVTEALSSGLFPQAMPRYTHAILNPPYKKMPSSSEHRRALRQVGIETVNLYSAFVALALELLEPNGQLVAIIPRSFCNGPYYRPFREWMLRRAAILHVHLFESRSSAFKDDDVLQENLILLLEKSARQGGVTISTSTDDTFTDLTSYVHAFEQIVASDDPELFIHVPTTPGSDNRRALTAFHYSLEDLGIRVSTGPVVDFRLWDHLRDMPELGTVPLLYPVHCQGQKVMWPVVGKKPNAIEHNAITEKWLLPTGYYCVVRRFSSKEERRRIVASVVDPASFPGVCVMGFENHLNVFHESKRGMSELLARGLALYLNSTAVDEQFRRFNGHTQVNATDLKRLRYPSRDALVQLGRWAVGDTLLTQEDIDTKLEALSREAK